MTRRSPSGRLASRLALPVCTCRRVSSVGVRAAGPLAPLLAEPQRDGASPASEEEESESDSARRIRRLWKIFGIRV